MKQKKEQKINILTSHKISAVNNKTKKILYSQWPNSWKAIRFKGYPRFEKVALDKMQSFSKKVFEASLFDSIMHRRTSRDFANSRIINKRELSTILYGAAITSGLHNDAQQNSLRAYPSAGARYPLEIYVILLRSMDLRKGIYHYHVRTHSLEYLWSCATHSLLDCFLRQSFVSKATAIIIVSSVMNRTTIKYSDRGYRFALFEAGHVMQNFSLIAEALKIKLCALGGFVDSKVVDLLELSGDEIVLYACAIN